VIVDHPQVLAGRYRIDERLGRGGMGTVFAGHDLRLDRDVAVKVLRDDLAHDPSLRRRFEREARSAARVAHPNTVAIYDTGEDDGPDDERDVFIVMERLSGRTLGHELGDGPLSEARLRDVAAQVLSVLAVAHAEGIVHRDVKPGNILLADDRSVKVGDFGIATTIEGGDTSTAVPLGTPAYTAPERLRGFAATPRSDLYSLAVVLYEAAAGVLPFTGDGPGEVAEAVVAGAHAPLAGLRPDLSPAFVQAVERALATDPDARFADAAAMEAALDGTAAPATATVPLHAGTPTAVLPTPPATPVPPRPSAPSRAAPARPRPRVGDRFGRGRLAAIAALFAVLVVAVVLLVTGGGDSPAPPAATTPTTAPVASAPGPAPPAPLARALDRLQQATQP
jgi:serine/threonine-protein kinase